MKRIYRKPAKTFRIQKIFLVSGVLTLLITLIITAIVFRFRSQNNSPAIASPSFRPNLNSLAQLAQTRVAFPPRPKENALFPKIYAQAYLLYDADSGYPIYQKNAYQPLPVASTTKLMTAILVLEKYPLNEVVTVDLASTKVPGSKIMLQPGEKITIEALLKGLLISSGNDAAYVLAKQMGTVENFVAAMNQKAKEMGLKNTRFYDPAGLNDNGHSSAFDLALMLRYLLQHDKFREIATIPETTLQSADGNISHELKNSNRLVTEEMYFEGCLGGKTGFTPTAGHILAVAARRNGHRLIAVVINTFENSKVASAKESQKLLDWGFKNVIF